MKRQHLVLGGTLAVAGWLALIGDKTPANTVSEPVTRAAKPSTRPASKASVINPPDAVAVLVLQSRRHLIGAIGTAMPTTIFASQNWEPPLPVTPKVKVLPPPAPVAPPLPFIYLGKQHQDNQWEVFLARGEQTFIVREQSVIDGTYHIDTIQPPQLTLTYLPLKQMQTLTIGGLE